MLLQEVYFASRATPADLLKCSFSTADLQLELVRDQNKENNAGTLQPLTDAGIKTGLINKMASSGLVMKDLKVAFDRNGEAGIESLLKEKDIHGHIRVTACKRSISAVAAYFQSGS